MGFDGDLFPVHANETEASLSLVGVFGHSGGGKSVIERIGVSKNELISFVHFPAADDMFMAIENGCHVVFLKNRPKSVSLRRLRVQAFFRFVAHRIGRFVKKDENVLFFISSEVLFEPSPLRVVDLVRVRLVAVQKNKMGIFEVKGIGKLGESLRSVGWKAESVRPYAVALVGA